MNEPLSIKKAEVNIFGLSSDYTNIITGTSVETPITDLEYQGGNYGKGALAYDGNGNIYYSGNGIYETNLSGNPQDIGSAKYVKYFNKESGLFNYVSAPGSFTYKEIRRGLTGLAYVPTEAELLAFESYQSGGLIDDGSGLFGNDAVADEYKFISSLPTQPHRIITRSKTRFGRKIGDKHYELSDHLGNVRYVIGDARIFEEVTETDGVFTVSTTDQQIMWSDYYPFGMVMPNGSCEGEEEVEIEELGEIVSNDFDTKGNTEGWNGCNNSTVNVDNGNLNIDGYFLVPTLWAACSDYDLKDKGFVKGDRVRFKIDMANTDFSAARIAIGVGVGFSHTSSQFLKEGINKFDIIVEGPTDKLLFFVHQRNPDAEDYTIRVNSIKVALVEKSTKTIPCAGIRQYGTSDYRYAFNGMEYDDEIQAGKNSYTTQFRQYDPRLGRWKSLDPLMAKYPNMSPYVAFGNNPVYYTDPYGLEPGNGEPEKVDKGEGGGEKFKGDDGVWYETTRAGGGKTISNKERANTKINSYEKKVDVISNFENISKEKLVSDLRSLVNNPENTKQLPNTCGLAACQYNILQDDPSAFVDFVINTYDSKTDMPTIKDGDGNSELDINDFNELESEGNSASWIFQGAIRNTYNGFLDYDPRKEKNDQTGGITTPSEVDDLMESFGYKREPILNVNNLNIQYNNLRVIILYDTDPTYLNTGVKWHYANVLSFPGLNYGDGFMYGRVNIFDTNGNRSVLMTPITAGPVGKKRRGIYGYSFGN